MSEIQINFGSPGTSEQYLCTAAATSFTQESFAPSTQTFKGCMANVAFIQVESDDVRYHVNGTTPAASCGHLGFLDGTIVLSGLDLIKNFKAVNTSAASSTLLVTFFF